MVNIFNLDIEKKIIEFIKNSPLGVTSSDIAHYLGLNRMTIAKYLAIIQEKTLVDFKQLGMTKLWYVPVTLSKEGYLKDLTLNISAEFNDEASRRKIKRAAISIAKDIGEMYKRFHGVEKLNYSQVVDSLIDAQRKIGGNFAFAERGEDVIVFKNIKCPFGERVRKAPGLCATTSALCGVMVARNLGYSKVVLKRTIAEGSNECLIYVYLNKTKEAEKGKIMDEYASV